MRWRPNASVRRVRRRCNHTQERVARIFARAMPALYKRMHSFFFTNLLLRPALKVKCPMMTVSDLIERYSLRCVAAAPPRCAAGHCDAAGPGPAGKGKR
jgi:hypothetical protein